MSNYRVRQVLALGPMPERQLRLLVALATFMSDESREVKVGFKDVLIECTGQTHNTVRDARNELQEGGRLSYVPGRGVGNLTLWTVLCLPAKGTNQAPEKVPTEGRKRYQAKPADLQEPDHGLNLQAKDSLSARLAEMLRSAVPDAAEREIDRVVEWAMSKTGPAGWLRMLITNGDAMANILKAREQLADADRREQRRRQLAEIDPRTGDDDPPDTEPADPAEVAALLDQFRRRLPGSVTANVNHAGRPTATVSDQQAGADRKLLEDLGPEHSQHLMAAAMQQLGNVPNVPTLDLVHAAAELARQARAMTTATTPAKSATDGSDPVPSTSHIKQPLADIPPLDPAIGPCAGCQQRTTRYGATGHPLCPACRPVTPPARPHATDDATDARSLAHAHA